MIFHTTAAPTAGVHFTPQRLQRPVSTTGCLCCIPKTQHTGCRFYRWPDGFEDRCPQCAAWLWFFRKLAPQMDLFEKPPRLIQQCGLWMREDLEELPMVRAWEDVQ